MNILRATMLQMKYLFTIKCHVNFNKFIITIYLFLIFTGSVVIKNTGDKYKIFLLYSVAFILTTIYNNIKEQCNITFVR